MHIDTVRTCACIVMLGCLCDHSIPLASSQALVINKLIPEPMYCTETSDTGEGEL